MVPSLFYTLFYIKRRRSVIRSGANARFCFCQDTQRGKGGEELARDMHIHHQSDHVTPFKGVFMCMNKKSLYSRPTPPAQIQIG